MNNECFYMKMIKCYIVSIFPLYMTRKNTTISLKHESTPQALGVLYNTVPQTDVTTSFSIKIFRFNTKKAVAIRGFSF